MHSNRPVLLDRSALVFHEMHNFFGCPLYNYTIFSYLHRVFLPDFNFYDNIKAYNKDIQSKGLYVGKVEYSDCIFQREISVKQAINKAIRRYNRYENINEVIQEFGLTQGRVEYKLSKYSGERLRASLAIGYASNKIVYCFPWMNTAYFYDIILSSGVFRFFNKLKEEGCIIILPTSREENVNGFVDKVININNPKFNYILSENQYFIQNIKRDNRPDFS